MNRFLITVVGTLAVGLMVLAPPVLAQSPDEETVCSPLKEDGITKGLYGLCVAFCEAQAITSADTPITVGELADIEGSAPSGKILAIYNKKKAENDPTMPCIKVEEPCPCWSAEDLENLATGAADEFWWCGISDSTDTATGIVDGMSMNDCDQDDTGCTFHYAAARDQHRSDPDFSNREQCYYQEPVTGPNGGSDSPRFFSVAAGTLTHEQAALCLAQVKAYCPDP